jgi:hypothetical protein
MLVGIKEGMSKTFTLKTFNFIQCFTIDNYYQGNYHGIHINPFVFYIGDFLVNPYCSKRFFRLFANACPKALEA